MVTKHRLQAYPLLVIRYKLAIWPYQTEPQLHTFILIFSIFVGFFIFFA